MTFAVLNACLICGASFYILVLVGDWLFGKERLNPDRYPTENSEDSDGFVNAAMFLSIED